MVDEDVLLCAMDLELFVFFVFFFFQAEDGIRDLYVTGVQTCALPILNAGFEQAARDLAVCFSWNSNTRGVDASDQIAPVCGPVSFAFAADGPRGLFV